MENEISVCIRNWEFKTWVLKPRFVNPDSWLLSKKAMINWEKSSKPNFVKNLFLKNKLSTNESTWIYNRLIRMSHWPQQMVDGAENLISWLDQCLYSLTTDSKSSAICWCQCDIRIFESYRQELPIKLHVFWFWKNKNKSEIKVKVKTKLHPY